MQNMLKPPVRARFGEHMPPAVFPSVFGLLGLGLAWRRGEPVFNLPPAVSQLILGAVTVLFLFALAAYLLKASRRAGVVVEDLTVLPGRAGLAAMVLSMFLLAAVLVPMSTALAGAVLAAGVAGYVLLVALAAKVLLTGPAEQRHVTPVFHLIFVGFILIPLSAVPLGLSALSEVLLYAGMAVAGVIWAASLVQLVRRDPPPPLRPLLAIHLAPASVLGTVALMLGNLTLGTIFAVFAGLILAALLLRARYVTAAGFSPLWGAFTFPLAAFSSLMLMLADAGQGPVFRAVGGVALVAGTLMIPAIAVKVMQAWAKGGLAAKTNAARV